MQAGSLPGFLRQHYTTSSEMAGLLSAYLVSNGAADTRYIGNQPKQAQEAKPSGPPDQLDRFGRRLRPATSPQEPAQQAARPDADGLGPQGDPARLGRNAKRPPRSGEPIDAAKPADGQPPAQAAIERGPDGRKLKLSKKGKPRPEEAPKTDSAKDEPPKVEPANDDKSKTDAAKDEGSKPDATKPSEEAKSEAAKADVAKGEVGKSETPALRADPVPAVTPAPKSPEGDTAPAQTAAPASPAPAPATTASSAAQEPSAAVSAPAAALPAPPPAVAASSPPPAPPAGPPAPPISQ